MRRIVDLARHVINMPWWGLAIFVIGFGALLLAVIWRSRANGFGARQSTLIWWGGTIEVGALLLVVICGLSYAFGSGPAVSWPILLVPSMVFGLCVMGAINSPPLRESRREPK
jgi:hypothetical protein